MSYCRLSSDDFQCDVYCYASEGGFTTHVARLRVLFEEPLPPAVSFHHDYAGWFARLQDVTRRVELAARVPIGLPHDGMTYTDSDAHALLGRLEQLRDLGYRIPASALRAVRSEIDVDDATAAAVAAVSQSVS